MGLRLVHRDSGAGVEFFTFLRLPASLTKTCNSLRRHAAIEFSEWFLWIHYSRVVTPGLSDNWIEHTS
jgi:hypothetical protein